MTVIELIEALGKFPANTPVKVWDNVLDEYEDAERLEWELEGGWIVIESERC